MALPITDTFDNIRQFTHYDENGTDVPSVDPYLAIFLANEVQNLRSFNHEIDRDRAQSDLDTATQVTPLPLLPSGMDSDTNLHVELYPRIQDEGWVDNPDAASVGITSFTYDKIAAYNYWKGLEAILAGGATTLNVASVMTDFRVDISGLDKVSLVADSVGTGTITSIDLQLLDSGAGDTGLVSLTNDVDARWIAPMSDFTGVDLTDIQTVAIYVGTDDAYTAGDLIHLFSVRAHNTAFDPSLGIGLNTIQGAVNVPVTFDLATPSYSLPWLLRGDGTTSDPTPEDVELRTLIDAGGLQATTGTDYHEVDLMLRQKMGEDTYTRVAFYWNDTDAKYELWSTVASSTTLLTSGAVDGATYDAVISGGDATGIFWLDAKLKNDGITVSLFASDANAELLTEYVILDDGGGDPFTDPALVRFRGRVGFGFFPNDNDRDTLLYTFIGVVLGLSTLTTKTFNSVTPVEAVQLFGSFAPDANLFTEFTGNVALDTIRSLSGQPTWKGTSALSNEFIVPDFTQSYIAFDIWVPQDADVIGDPLYLQLQGVGGPSNIDLPVQDDLQAGIWNRVEVDLSPYSGLGIDGATYQLAVGDNALLDLSWIFNIDYMTVGHRRVAWAASCDGGDNFYFFRDCVNDIDAALHFPRVDVNGNPGRGTQLVIQAEALTDDAWLSSFTIQVTYAELGKPVYY